MALSEKGDRMVLTTRAARVARVPSMTRVERIVVNYRLCPTISSTVEYLFVIWHMVCQCSPSSSCYSLTKSYISPLRHLSRQIGHSW